MSATEAIYAIMSREVVSTRAVLTVATLSVVGTGQCTQWLLSSSAGRANGSRPVAGAATVAVVVLEQMESGLRCPRGLLLLGVSPDAAG